MTDPAMPPPPPPRPEPSGVKVMLQRCRTAGVVGAAVTVFGWVWIGGTTAGSIVLYFTDSRNEDTGVLLTQADRFENLYVALLNGFLAGAILVTIGWVLRLIAEHIALSWATRQEVR